jgi:hypothetical protein
MIKKIIFTKKSVYITITSIRLKSWWHFFELARLSIAIQEQLKKQNGFISMKRSGFGYIHYTLSVWQSEEALKLFAKEGSHRVAMSRTAAVATETLTHTYQSDNIPNWKEARRLLGLHGKLLSFKK